MKKIISLVLGMSMVFSYAFASNTTAVTSSHENESAFDTNKIRLLKEMISDLYYKEVTDEELYEAAVKGMFQSLDSYSAYYNKDETASFEEDISGQYAGIGIKFTEYDNCMQIVKVFSNTPAYTAGILEGDYIIGVNGEKIYGWSLNKVASVIRGEPGTKVDIELLRNGNVINITTQRAEVQAESCEFYVYGKDSNIGYIKISEFNASTSSEVTRYLKFMKLYGMDRLILDLRDNFGGYVDQAILVARNFVPSGTITTLKYKNSSKDRIYVSSLKEPYFKVIALVNGNSASASEILAGALKDSGSATLVGTRTFGKGVFQSLYNLVDGGSVKITTGSYYTPSGVCIDKIGIEPDILVEIEGEQQLNRAIEEAEKL